MQFSHPVHFSWSICALLKNSDIASDGQERMHNPHPLQNSGFTCSILAISYPRLQVPSVEHGGVSQRSVLPQQVVPLGLEDPIMTAPGAEINFANRFEPQCLHTMLSLSFLLVNSISVTLLQSLHLYS
jgi:hypothetical protein